MDNNSWRSYPKIYNIGHRAIADLFMDPVIIEEKVDGSQFSFGVYDGEIKCRSKGVAQDIDGPDKLFAEGCEVAKKMIADGKLMNNYMYTFEYLQKPDHNVLAYDRIPKDHLMLLDVRKGNEDYMTRAEKEAEAKRIGLEVVPCILFGKIDDVETLMKLLDTVSILGGQKIEGFVVKNYSRFTPDGKVMMGKHVSEAFKEVHRKDWKEKNPVSKDVIQVLMDMYRTEARWNKAIQHLKEDGRLDGSPKDIGPLMKEVGIDIKSECEDEIKEKLFKWAWPHIQRASTRGLPEWYKDKLLKSAFKEDKQ